MGRDRKTLAWGMLLLLVGAIGLLRALGLEGHFFNSLFAAGFLAGGAALLVLAASGNFARRAFWLLPAGVMAAAGFINLGQAIGFMPESLASIAIATGFAIPLAFIHRLDPSRAWALWGTWLAAAIGVASALHELGRWGEALAGTAFLWAAAVPFVVMFLRRGREWPLLAAGSLATIGFLPLAEALRVSDAFGAAIFCLGMAATFAAVYVLGRPGRVGWARIAAIVAGTIAVTIVVSGPALRFLLPIGLIAAGSWLIFNSRSAARVSLHTDGPTAPTAPPAEPSVG